MIRLVIPNLFNVEGSWVFISEIAVLPIVNNFDVFVAGPGLLGIMTVYQPGAIGRNVDAWIVVDLNQRMRSFGLFAGWPLSAFAAAFGGWFGVVELLGCVWSVVFIYRVLLYWKLVWLLRLNWLSFLLSFLFLCNGTNLRCWGGLFLFKKTLLEGSDGWCAYFALIQLHGALLPLIFRFRSRLISSFYMFGRPVLLSFRFQLHLKVAEGLSLLFYWVFLCGLDVAVFAGTEARHVGLLPLLCYFRPHTLLNMSAVFAHFLAIRVPTG